MHTWDRNPYFFSIFIQPKPRAWDAYEKGELYRTPLTAHVAFWDRTACHIRHECQSPSGPMDKTGADSWDLTSSCWLINLSPCPGQEKQVVDHYPDHWSNWRGHGVSLHWEGPVKLTAIYFSLNAHTEQQVTIVSINTYCIWFKFKIKALNII